MTTVISQVRVATKEKSVKDNELFERIIKYDDERAFQYLFETYYESLCRYALYFVSAPMVAEEVVSDVFLKIWNNRKKIKITFSFNAYVFRAVHNQSLDYLRSKSARQAYNLEEINYSHELPTESPEEQLLFDELHTKIEAAIESLAPQARLIFRMSRDQGLKYREIAAQLQLSIKTVETQMGRALKQLRCKVY
ncbi:MAG: RNA polymerase sigma-70 factor [Thermonemataceae bacterium]